MAHGQAPLIGAIADDLTGATDLALTLSRGGMRVRQLVGVPQTGAGLGDADAIVVSLKSRTIPAAEAVSQSVAAAKALLAAGARQMFFKYCSTFDSTDEGNIGPVTEALMALMGEERTLACPAFPTNSRTVYKGHLFVGDQLLSESSMKDHPLTPMRDANLVRVLGRQTDLPVSLIEISAVRGGSDALRETLSTLRGVAVIDALEDADLYAIGAAASDLRLITGGSGVALGLPGNFVLANPPTVKSVDMPSGRAVVLAGSCSAATRRQVKMAISAGAPSFNVDPFELAEGRTSAGDAIAFATDAAEGGVPVIYATAEPDLVRRVQKELGRDRAGALIEDFLGRVAMGLAEGDFDRMLVAGGETSGAVIDRLGISELDVGREIDPGVPWMLTERAGRPMAVALKSGNFGAEDIFLSAWEKLK